MIIKIPATSANLGPGFDALGLSLELFNVVEITEQKVTSVSLCGEGSEKISLRKNNSFLNIFREIYSKLSSNQANFRFVFQNNIPFSRGLGSSSAVIVGAIAAAHEMCGFSVDRSKILNLALEYENHPDNIAPAVHGGFVSSIVDNGKVYCQKCEISPDIKAVVVIPNKPMSTNESRTKLPKNYTMKECVSNLAHAAFLTACFMKQDYKMLRLACIDKMHEEIRMASLPELFKVREIAYKNGALMSSLSGSGSSFLNLTLKDNADRLKKVLLENFTEFRVEILDIDNGGFKIN
ncbi:MAG: homoserine kinase [Campylobacter sp.]|nr:homoserine kinase [Campylobacter sp.]